MYSNLYIYLLASVLIYITTAYVCGMAVTYKGVRVNYTRKINHFVQFLLPAGLIALPQYHPMKSEQRTERKTHASALLARVSIFFLWCSVVLVCHIHKL